MTTQKQLQAMTIYRDLMDEIKTRLTAITRVVATAPSNPNDLPGVLIREFCFLQVRMICEAIALACLAAHGDIAGIKTSKLQKEYSAAEIMKRLGTLHPNFYPQPVRYFSTGPKTNATEPISVGHLSREALERLYGKCGVALHRGSIKSLVSQMPRVQTDFSDFIRWVAEISTLLNVHVVAMFDADEIFMCFLNGAGGGVEIRHAVAR